MRMSGLSLLIALLWLARVLPVNADDPIPSIRFPIKIFFDDGQLVHLEGTLTGDGIGYPNNRSAVICYQQRRECIVVHVETEGAQIFPLNLPAFFTVQVWAADRIVADEAEPCGYQPDERLKRDWQTTRSSTWIIDRERQSAELIEHPCLGAKTYHWTIEDPAFRKKAKEGLGTPTPR